MGTLWRPPVVRCARQKQQLRTRAPHHENQVVGLLARSERRLLPVVDDARVGDAAAPQDHLDDALIRDDILCLWIPA